MAPAQVKFSIVRKIYFDFKITVRNKQAHRTV